MIFYRRIVVIYELFIKYIHHQHNFNCNQINYFEIESNNAISIALLMLLSIDFLINICFCIIEYQIEDKYMILKPAICLYWKIYNDCIIIIWSGIILIVFSHLSYVKDIHISFYKIIR